MGAVAAWPQVRLAMEQEPDRHEAKRLREQMGLLQPEFADHIGCSRGRYSMWESNTDPDNPVPLKRKSWGPLNELIASGGQSAAMSKDVDDTEFVIQQLEKVIAALRSKKMSTDSKVFFYRQIITSLYRNMKTFTAKLEEGG